MYPVPGSRFIVVCMETLLYMDACTLPVAERPLRLAEFDALFALTVTRVERRGTNMRLHLSGSRGLRDHVRDLTKRESSCCSFFVFDIAGTDDELTLDVAVPPAHQEILEALAARAEELAA